MELIGILFLVGICLIFFGLLGKLLGLIWMILGWLMNGVFNCAGCFVWFFIIFILLLALA